MTEEIIMKSAEELQLVANEYLELQQYAPEVVSMSDALISNRGRLYRIIKSSNGGSTKIKKSGDEVIFETPIYLEYVYLKSSNEPSEIRVVVKAVDGHHAALSGRKSKDKAGHLTYPYRGLIQSISISTDNMLVMPIIESLSIFGYSLEDLHAVSNGLRQLIEIEERLNARANDLDKAINKSLEKSQKQHDSLENRALDIEEAISESTAALGVHNESRDIAKSEREKAEADLEVARAALSGVKSELSLSQDSVAKLKDQEVDLDEKVRTKRVEHSQVSNALEALKRERSLYSDELSDYAKHGDRTVTTYVILSIIPAATIFYYSLYVINSASALMAGSFSTFEAAASAVIARIPFALISALVIAACYLSLEALIKRVIDLHKDRLFIHKLSILANSAVQSATRGQDISVDESNKIIVQAKVSLINDYLMRNSVLEQVQSAPKKERAGLVDSLAKLVPSLGALWRRDGSAD